MFIVMTTVKINR